MFRHFFDHSLTAAAILDRNFNFICVNELYASMDGKTVSDFPGKNHFELYPSTANQAIFQGVVDTKQPYQAYAKPFVYEYNRERGITYWDWTLVPVLGADGEVELLLFSLRDVTHQKRAEIELQHLFELSVDLFCLADVQTGKYVRVNPAFTETLGFTAEELLSRPLVDWLHPEDRDSFVSPMRELGEQTVWSFTIRHRCKDGSYRHLRWNCTRMSTAGHIYGVARDITDDLKMQEQIIRLERAKLIGEMASAIGHEIRNPMAAVRGFLQLTGMRGERPDPVEIDRAIAELDRISSVVDQFLEIAVDRPSAHQLQSLSDVVQDLVPLVEASAAAYGARVLVETQAVASVEITREEISQLTLNLCRMVLESTGQGGKLTICTRQEGERALMLIRSTGRRKRSVEAIQHDSVDGTVSDQLYDGPRLGMLFCDSIVERHGGRLKVSEAEDGMEVVVEFEL